MTDDTTQSQDETPRSSGAPNSEQREALDTIRRVLRIRIDGEWDETMIHAAFDRLERLAFGGAEEEEPAAREEAQPPQVPQPQPQQQRSRAGGPRRRGRRG